VEQKTKIRTEFGVGFLVDFQQVF